MFAVNAGQGGSFIRWHPFRAVFFQRFTGRMLQILPIRFERHSDPGGIFIIVYQPPDLTVNQMDLLYHYKWIDCSNYPYVARFSLGLKAATSEYRDISDDEKGPITDRNQLKVGMEIFQSESFGGYQMKHMGVYAGLVTFNNGETRHAVYQSRAVYNANQLAIYDEETGPNLTEMNDDWYYWGWS